MFTSNSSTSAYYNIWSKINFQFYPTFIDNCGEDNLQKIYDEYLSLNAYYKHTFNQKKFHKYFKRFEKKFKCTGFCGLNYFNDITKTNQKIVKYLFSDINNGIPEHFGCLHVMIYWIKKIILSFGINSIILFVCQFGLFIFGIILKYSSSENENNYNNK